MAITKDRATSNNLVDLVDRSYITAVDRTKDTAPNKGNEYKPKAMSSKGAAAGGKRNVFDKHAVPDTVPAVTNPVAGNRSLLDPSISVSNLSPDGALAARSVLDHVTAGLPETNILAIETMLGTNFNLSAKQTRFLTTADKDANILRGVSSVKKALSETGSTLREKTHMKSLLSCANGAGLNANESALILGIIIAGLLAQAICMGVNKLLDTIADLAASGMGTDSDITRGVLAAFAGAKGRSASDKTAVLAALPAMLGAPNASRLALTAGASALFLDSLKGSKPNAKNATKEHADSVAAMDNIDPGWRTDSSGKPNMSRTKGNDYLAKVNSNKLKSGTTPASAIPTSPGALPVGSAKYNSLLVVAANTVNKEVSDGSKIGLKDYPK